MSSPPTEGSKFSVRKVRKSSIRNFQALDEEYSSSPTTRFLEQKEAKQESDMLRALQNLPSAETALQLTPMPQQQNVTPRHSNAAEDDLLPSSVVALQSEQVKELYPSDDDEDFDIYIASTKPRSNSNDVGTPRDSIAGINEQQEGKKGGLKFTEYLSNPLFDKSAAQEKPEISMTEEEVIVYNEVVRLMVINGDPQCSNPYLMKRITKTVRNRTKSGVARGYVPSARVRSSSVLSLTSETSTDDIDEEMAEENKRYNIKTCSKSWKSQLKALKNTSTSPPSSPPSSTSEVSVTPTTTDVLPLKSNVLYSACSPATGYLPEWKYSMTAKRILDTCRTQGFKI